MSKEIEVQSRYWDRQSGAFEKIYSKKKHFLLCLADKLFRGEIFTRFDYVVENAQPIKGHTFLDVGCGSGKYVNYFSARGAKRIVGIDVSEKMLDIARRAKGLKGDNVSFIKTDLLSMKGGEQFDIVIAVDLFDYVKDPLPVIKKMKTRALSKIIITLPRLWTWRAPIRKLRLYLRGCPVYFYSPSRVRSILKKACLSENYEVKKIGTIYGIVIRV